MSDREAAVAALAEALNDGANPDMLDVGRDLANAAIRYFEDASPDAAPALVAYLAAPQPEPSEDQVRRDAITADQRWSQGYAAGRAAGLRQAEDEARLRAALESMDTPRDAAPKRNGWHTYHICDGRLREVTGIAHNLGTIVAITCAHCGEWFEPHVSSTRPRYPSDD